ncbi:MAG: peptidase, partial [Planctomycetota bacterium]
DDFIVGFAERGETIFNSSGGATSFLGTGVGTPGEYQLEIRNATPFGESDTFTGSQSLFADFDTNDRHLQAITLVAPAGSQINDGDFFEISDGRVTQVFEFSLDNTVTFGRQRIRYNPGDSSVDVAESLRDAINNSSVLDMRATSAGGSETSDMTGRRVNLYGAVGGSLQTLTSLADAPADNAAVTLQRDADGQLQLPAILLDGFGDRNHQRTQGQVIIENNTISDVHAIGIYTEAGDRGVDIEDLRQDPFNGGTIGFDAAGDVFGGDTTVTAPHPFLQLPPVGNPAAGVVRNLPVANDSVLGGLMPGVVIRNNTIDQAGQSGVKVEGESRPFVIENFPFGSFLPDADDAEDLEILLSSGNGVVDGFAIAIDAGGTRVVFEFEDVAGIDVMDGGSGVAGGDGFADGHVPVFYRHIGLGGYNDPPDDPQERDYPYNSFELLLALQQAIQGSILVTNDSVELVTPTLGPSMNTRNGFFEEFQPTPEYFPTPALYLEGVTQIYQTNVYSKLPAGALSISQLEVAEAPQPLARVVNNSIYGADGTESAFPESAASDGNDLLANATVTHVGRAHTGAYVQTATIGDQNLDGVDAINDVDFYQVELMVGDRLIVDIDTALNGPSTAVQIIDESGVRISLDGSTVASTGFAPDHLNLSGSIIDETVGDTTQDDLGIDAGSPLLRRADPFVDFTATASGTYYIAVSSLGNTDFDPENVSGRSGGIGGLGDYQIGIEAYAPRSFVVSLDDGVEGEGNLGTTGADVIGTTFTITQIPDFLPNTPNYGPGFGGSPNTDGNQLTFEFTDTLTGTIAPSGNINVPLLPEHRTQDIMRAISNAITGVVDPIARIDTAPLPNHEDGNGPGGINGPISRATAQAIGGSMGDNLGIVNLSDPSRRPGILRTLPPLHYILQNDTDFFGSYLGLRNSEGGFGHSRREADLSIELIPAGTVTDSLGTSELYVKIDNVAGITLSDEAIAAGLRLTPDAAKPEFAQNADQIIPESGIWISNGASPTVFNNALSNLHQSILSDETSITGFGQRVLSDPSGDLTVKPQEIVIVGNAFQYDESRNTEPRFNLTWPVDTIEPLDVIDTGISTDAIVGATNVASDSDDFNFVADNGNPYFVDAAGNDFQPAPGSILIDSGVSEVTERGDFETLKASVGLPPSNILAPQRDVFGVLRVDNRDFASPGAVGEDVFVDRGSVELGDFIGPSAIAVTPTDNDAAGLDADENVSVIDRLIGGLTEFQIQLVDTADAGNPFTGIGVDDQTVIVPEIDGLRLPGAKLAVFENDVLLEEGVDYTFSYDSTANLITLTPLAGVWDYQSS